MRAPALFMLKVSCSNLERSRAFYGELGFEPDGEPATAEAPWLASLYGIAGARIRAQQLRAAHGAAPVRLELLEWAAPASAARPSIDTPGCAGLSFRTDDLDATASRLVEAGGRIVGTIPEFPGGRSTTRLVNVADPDGLTLQLVEVRRLNSSGPQ